MSNKCFITKLPTTVKNDSLPIYGELIIHSTKNGCFRVDYKGDIPNKEIYSDANMLYVKNVDINQDTHVNYNNDNYQRVSIGVNTSILAKSEADVHIPNKYNIIRIGSLTVIPLPNGQIPGTITLDLSDIKYLTALTTLYSPNAGISGDISSLSNLTALTTLNLQETHVEGDISSLSNLTALTTLNLQETHVEGDISSLSNLTALTTLNLQNTHVEGDISSLSNLTALTTLNLQNTDISGDISAIVTNCTNLKELSIPRNVKITDEQKKTLTDRGCTVTISN